MPLLGPHYYTTPGVRDNKGEFFDPGMCEHTYTHDAGGNIETDSATDPDGVVRVKTFTWTSNLIATETPWVVEE